MPAEDSRPVRVHLADGSWLEVAAVRVLAGEAWRFRLACGVDLIARQPDFSAAEIVAVRSPGAGAAEDASAYWLGEATPLRVVRVPLIGEPQASAERRGWSAPRLLEHEGRLRIWPIAMRAGTQAVYRLPSREGGVLRFALGGMAADGEGPLREGELRFRVQSVRSSGALQVLWQRDWSAVAAGDASGIVEIKVPPGPAIVLEVLRPRGRAAAAVGLWIDPVVWGP
jgi:hypothetical protein